MKKRALEMHAEMWWYTVCLAAKAMHIGGKKPRYLVDLLFGEDTVPGTFEPDGWHAELDRFISEH